MKLTITGSGGFRRTPRPGCGCKVCREARERGTQRLGPSMFIHDENILFDTPEEIAAELENAGIGQIDHLFYTHWHPDHTMGARILEVMNSKWADEMEWRMAARRSSRVYMPGQVHDEIMQRFGQFFEFWEHMGIAAIQRLEGGIHIGGILIEPVILTSIHRTMTHSTVYIISSRGKKIIYAPCDIIPFPEDERFHGCDLMILQAGWTGPELAERARRGPHYEISMDEIASIAEKYRPGKVILTHLGDELGLLEADLRVMEERYRKFNLRFAHDGMTVDI